MADNLPRSSSTVEVFEVIRGSLLLDELENGNLTRETAKSKKRKMAVRYHSEDIEECFNKVRRSNNYPTVTDMEKSLDETQGTPRKKKFDELEEVIIGLQDTQKSLKQIIELKDEEMRQNDQVLRQELRQKDEEIRRKDEELDRLRRLLGQETK